MDLLAFIQAAVLGLVEGLVEFLPVSASGHLILARALLGLRHDEAAQAFDLALRSGALLALVGVFWRRFVETVAGLRSGPESRRLLANLAVASVPAAFLGFGLTDAIRSALYTGPIVAAASCLGALAILWVERPGAEQRVRVASQADLHWMDALAIGLLQCLSLIPGLSRPGTAMIGGMLLGLSRRVATEFSMVLAIPTLLGALVHSGWQAHHALAAQAAGSMFAVGFVASFAAAWVCVRWLLRYVQAHTFVPFAWYRIAFALVVLASWLTDLIRWTP